MKQICNWCKEEKELSEFYFRSDSKKYKTVCKVCNRANAKQHREKPENKNKILKYQRNLFRAKRDLLLLELGGKCSKCGISDYRVLDIHHSNPEKKQYKPTHSNHKRILDWQINKDELELLCANCHRIETHTQRGWTMPNEMTESKFKELKTATKRVKQIKLMDEFPEHLRLRNFPLIFKNKF